MNSTVSIWITVPFLCLLLGVAVYDWKTRLIKNKVILPALGVAFLVRLIMQDMSMTESLFGLLFAGGIFWAGAWMGMTGGGDVKLMALVGFVLGLWHVLSVLVLLCLFLLATWLVRGNRQVAFAPYIFAAVCLAYLIPWLKGVVL